MAKIFADITADRQSIALIAVGEGVDWTGQPDVLRAAKQLEKLPPLFSKSDPPGALTVPATWPAVVQLSATFGEAFKPQTALADWIQAEITSRTTTPEVTYRPPAGLTPYPWQVEGQALIAATGRALIFDEPRTGKTASAILGLVEWAGRRWNKALGVLPVFGGPVVVICPAGVIDPWVEAWQTWAPHVRTVAWHGAKRKTLLGTADVYVTSYDTARVDAPAAGTRAMRPFEELNPVAVVLDECHLVKNPQAARTKAVHRITSLATAQGGAVVALSGTPITHGPGDLHPTLKALEPGAWPSKERYVERYCDVLKGDYKDTELGLNKHREPEFRLTILGQHRRVARADVMAQLPPKVYSTRTVDLPKEWRKVYDDFETAMYAEMPDGEELSVLDALSKLTHLATLASTACDVEVTHGPDVDLETGEPKRHVHLHPKAPSWKVDTLLEVLEERRGEPVLVFAPGRKLIELAGAAVAEAEHRVGYIVGGQSKGERTRQRLAFQEEKSLDVLCVTTSAGGVGITLNRAETVVYLQRPYSLVDSVQSEDRSEGDFNAVRGTEVVDIVARNTIDSRVRAVLRERAAQLADLVQDPRVLRDLLGGTRTERKTA